MPEVARPTTGSSLLSASEAEANDVSLHAESATAPGAGLFDSPETAIDSTTPAPPRTSTRPKESCSEQASNPAIA